MRAYVGITGLVFALIFAMHVARILAEGSGLHEPIIIVTSLLALGLSIWALVLLARGPR
jgi:positive regulator of sigma E activity